MSESIRVEPSQDDQWYVRITAGNGETRLVSETYTRKSDAIRAAQNIAELMPRATLHLPDDT